MKYIEPITDRTATDITNKTAKAYFNLIDWNRINGNTLIVEALVEFLLSIGISNTSLSVPTITTIPTVAQINSLITNINNILAASGLPALTGLADLKDDWTAGSGSISPDYEDVNDWEDVLDIIFNNIGKSVEFTVYCGVASVGQTRFYQHRWRQYGWVPESETPVRVPRVNVGDCGSGLMRQNGFRRYA